MTRRERTREPKRALYPEQAEAVDAIFGWPHKLTRCEVKCGRCSTVIGGVYEPGMLDEDTGHIHEFSYYGVDVGALLDLYVFEGSYLEAQKRNGKPRGSVDNWDNAYVILEGPAADAVPSVIEFFCPNDGTITYQRSQILDALARARRDDEVISLRVRAR